MGLSFYNIRSSLHDYRHQNNNNIIAISKTKIITNYVHVFV